jgi:lipoprotein-releasing system permease protein
MAAIRNAVGDKVVGMSPTAAVPALIYMQVGGGISTRPVTLVGIDEKTYASVSSVGKYLQHPANRRQLSFNLHEGGYDVVDHLAADPKQAKRREEFDFAGGLYRRAVANQKRMQAEIYQQMHPAAAAAGTPEIKDPFASKAGAATEPADVNAIPDDEQFPGIVLAMSELSVTDPDGTVHLYNRPGDDVRVSYPKASIPPEALSNTYDCRRTRTQCGSKTLRWQFVPLAHAEAAMTTRRPAPGASRRSKSSWPRRRASVIRDKLRNVFNPQLYTVSTWQDNQAMLIHAIETETMVLTSCCSSSWLLQALASWRSSMIVVEKT